SEGLDARTTVPRSVASRIPLVVGPDKETGEDILQHVSMEFSREKLLQRAAENIFTWQLFSAGPYLSFRKESVSLLKKLYASKKVVKQELGLLEGLLGQLRELSVSTKTLNQVITMPSNSMHDAEDSSKCVVPVDDLQAHALEFLSEIHALDDALELLERSLRAGQLSCEEYVRRVSDIGREQFEARFLFARVAEAVNRVCAKTGQPLPTMPPRTTSKPAPGNGPIQVPTKMKSVDLLLREFPEVDSEMVKTVLNAVDGNVPDARVQLKAMLS
ncbi:uncharacterized protein Tco025E_06342, partial [Trypanosoma conorhini]